MLTLPGEGNVLSSAGNGENLYYTGIATFLLVGTGQSCPDKGI
jgi:hypothetical protein